MTRPISHVYFELVQLSQPARCSYCETKIPENTFSLLHTRPGGETHVFHLEEACSAIKDFVLEILGRLKSTHECPICSCSIAPIPIENSDEGSSSSQSTGSSTESQIRFIVGLAHTHLNCSYCLNPIENKTLVIGHIDHTGGHWSHTDCAGNTALAIALSGQCQSCNQPGDFTPQETDSATTLHDDALGSFLMVPASPPQEGFVEVVGDERNSSTSPVRGRSYSPEAPDERDSAASDDLEGEPSSKNIKKENSEASDGESSTALRSASIAEDEGSSCPPCEQLTQAFLWGAGVAGAIRFLGPDGCNIQ